MEPNERVSLCTECDMCPEVQLYDNEVLIGEEGNKRLCKMLKVIEDVL